MLPEWQSAHADPALGDGQRQDTATVDNLHARARNGRVGFGMNDDHDYTQFDVSRRTNQWGYQAKVNMKRTAQPVVLPKPNRYAPVRREMTFRFRRKPRAPLSWLLNARVRA